MRDDDQDGGADLRGAAERAPRLCVLAATPMLTVTIESAADSDLPEMHVHAGGQGLVARMAHALLVASVDADVVVLGGAEPADVIPAEFLGRLAGDLRGTGRTVVADLSGDAAHAVLEPGSTC